MRLTALLALLGLGCDAEPPEPTARDACLDWIVCALDCQRAGLPDDCWCEPPDDAFTQAGADLAAEFRDADFSNALRCLDSTYGG